MASRAQLWLNFGRTCNLGLANFSLGLVTAVAGATLMDLVQLYGSSMASISYLTTTRGVGSLLGSLLGGKLYDTFNTQVVSILATAVICVTVVMTPLCGYLPIAHVVQFVLGLSAAAFGTGAHVWIIRMWPNSTPALQAYHLAFGIGGLLGPFIARPFLSSSVGGNATSKNGSIFNLGRDDNSSDTNGLLLTPNYTAATNSTSETHIYYAFGIVGAFYFVATVSMIVLYLVDKADFKPEKAHQIANESSAVVEQPAKDIFFSRTVLAAMCIYLGFYLAFETTTSQMVVTFAVKSDLHFSKSKASSIESMFFLCFSASRLAAAVVTVKLPSFWMLLISHVILLPTAAMLTVWGSSISTILWVGTALSGIGDGPIYAAMISWIARHIEFSNKMMSLAVVTESISSMLALVIVGQFIDKTPNVFLYVGITAISLCTVVFFFIYYYLKKGPHLSKDKELLINEADKEPHGEVLS